MEEQSRSMIGRSSSADSLTTERRTAELIGLGNRHSHRTELNRQIEWRELELATCVFKRAP